LACRCAWATHRARRSMALAAHVRARHLVHRNRAHHARKQQRQLRPTTPWLRYSPTPNSWRNA